MVYFHPEIISFLPIWSTTRFCGRLYRLSREQGIDLSFVPADRKGNINYGDFESLIRPETRAVVTTHASNLTGNLLDIAKISRIAKNHGLLYIVDASQTAGSFNINMQEQQIDVLCFTGHKGLMGPQGTGGICVAEDVLIRPFKVGGTGVFFVFRNPAGFLPRSSGGRHAERARHRRAVGRG